MKNSKLFLRGILNSLGVIAYVFLLVLVMNSAQDIFKAENELIAPMIFLILFVFSALITGALILGRPITLYLNGAKKEGLKLLFYTGISLFILLAIAFVVLFLTK